MCSTPGTPSRPSATPHAGSAPAALSALAGTHGTAAARGVRLEVVLCEIDLDAAPAATPDAYLRLHLLSHRLVRPREVNLDGMFGVLPNVVWTTAGPCAVEDFELTRARLRRTGPVQVLGVDKFPRMVDYVVPAGVRIADADRVRLGAHLAAGTTVMHEGFVNYNAGTLGASMVEGRVSAGVVVGEGSDVGGGASIMGTLSGGGTEQVTIGERCLIGANAGVGYLPRRRLRGRGRHLHHGRFQAHPARRHHGEGPRAVRPVGPAVLAQQRERRAGGAAACRRLGVAQRRPARERMSRATNARRTIVVLVAATAVVLLGVWGLSHLWDKAKHAFTATECTFGGYSLDPDQAAVASTMVGVVTAARAARAGRRAGARGGDAGEQADQHPRRPG